MIIKQCPKCNEYYHYDILKCLVCNKLLEKPKISNLKPIFHSEVKIRSTSHPEVPYHINLLEDSNGALLLRKTNEKITSEVSDDRNEFSKKAVGIIGTGIMGVGIAEIVLESHNVILFSRSMEKARNAEAEIYTKLSKKYEPGELEKLKKNFKVTDSLEVLSSADIVIESIVEDKETKNKILQELDKVCKSSIIGTNTSSLSVENLSKNITRTEAFVGLHFFNPVSKMKLVEIVKTKDTNEAILKEMLQFIRSINKIPIVVEDSPGFIVNRMLMPYLNVAANIYSAGHATAEDIDKAAKFGLNVPMGPLSLIDLIGVDTCISILETLKEKTGSEDLKPSAALIELLKARKLGRKSGEGFFKY